MGKARQRFPPSLDETVETLQSLFGLIDKPTGAGGNNGVGWVFKDYRETVQFLSLWGLMVSFRCLSVSPSSSLQIIFFCFSISIRSLEIAAACRLCPSFQLRLPHLRRIFAPWFLMSQETLDFPPPRRSPSAQVSILGGGQDQRQGYMVQTGAGAEGRSLRRVWEGKQRSALEFSTGSELLSVTLPREERGWPLSSSLTPSKLPPGLSQLCTPRRP